MEDDTIFIGFEDVVAHFQDETVVDVIYLGAELQVNDRLRRVVYVELGFGGSHRAAFANMKDELRQSPGVELQETDVRGGGRFIADSFVKEIEYHGGSHDFGRGPGWILEELGGHLLEFFEQWEIKF